MRKSAIFSKYENDSPESIEFRRINAKIKNLNTACQTTKILITSSIAGEGKSTISTLLAITFSRHSPGDTLLVDCDLRRPKIHKILGIEKQNGLAETLQGDATPLDVIKNTAIKNLKVITSGNLKETPTKLLTLSNIKNIFEKLQPSFEQIIIDSPPVIPVNDSLILGSVADTTLLIIKAGKTQKEVTKRAIDLIKDAGIKTTALLVNNLENVLPYYYNYNYYKYKY